MYDDKFLEETLRKAFADEENYYVPIGIRRHDFKGVHGWWVRVSRDRVMFRQLFSDGVCGSIEAALKEAILYRHEILSSFPVTIKYNSNRGLDKEPENRIKRYEEKGVNRPYVYWKARWYDKNHNIETENFSVFKYGEEKAKSLAYEAARDRHNKKPKLSKVKDQYLTQKYEPKSRADVAIWATINDNVRSSEKKKNNEQVEHDPHAFEGERKFVLHQAIERDRKFRDKKIADFLAENECLFCELCHFSFKDSFPFLSKDIIEVHHITPLASLSKSTKVKLSDLMLLCSNCHFAIHQGDVEENLLLAMEHFENIDGNNNESR